MQNILNRKRKGFTLIELIVVIAIIGILVLLAMPKFMDYTRDAKDAKTQHDARVAEDAVTEHLIGNDDKLPEGLSEVTPGDIQDAIDEGRAYGPEGPVAEVPEGPYVDVTDLEEVKNGDIKTDGKIISNSNGDVFILLDKAIRADVCVLRADQKMYVASYEFYGNVDSTTYTSPNYENAEAVKAKYPTAEFYKFTEDGKSFIGFFTNNDKDTREVTLVDYYGDGTSVIVPGEVAVDLDSYTTDVHTVIASDVQNVIDPSAITFELPCTVTGTMITGDAGDTGDSLVPDGWIPVASADELNQIREEGMSLTFGAGTDWEGSYIAGLDKNYIQVADIDLSTYTTGMGWEPLGEYYGYGNVANIPFTGVYDGNGMNISNMHINRSGEAENSYSVGLFSFIENATVKNVNLVEPQYKYSWISYGAVSGVSSSSVISDINIVNIDLSPTDTADNVGALIGESHKDTISNINITGTGYFSVGADFVGGAVGYVTDSSKLTNIHVKMDLIDDSYNNKSYLGGIVGWLDEGSSLTKVSYEGNVEGDYGIGGIVGFAADSNISIFHSSGTVTAHNSTAGGVAGEAYFTYINNGYTTMSVTAGNTLKGAVLGSSDWDTYVYDVYYRNTELSTVGIAKTDAELKDRNTFIGWNFYTVWEIKPDSYPTFRIQEQSSETEGDNDIVLREDQILTGPITAQRNEYDFSGRFEGNQVYTVGDYDFGILSESEKTAAIVYYAGPDGPDVDLVIPGMIIADGISYTVTKIEEDDAWYGAFKYIVASTIEIPPTIIEIGRYAFEGGEFKTLDIPNSVKVIKEGAFTYNELESVTIPSSVENMESYVFADNPYLTSIIVDEANPVYKSIDNAIYSKDGTALLTGTKGMANNIDSNTISIAEAACYGMGITSVTIPDGVTSIGYNAFSRNDITSIVIPDTVVHIGDYAFSYNQIASLQLSNSLNHLGEYAFYNNLLTSVELPSSLTEVGKNSFYNNNIVSINILGSISSSADAFRNNGPSKNSNSLPGTGPWAGIWNLNLTTWVQQ